MDTIFKLEREIPNSFGATTQPRRRGAFTIHPAIPKLEDT